MKRMTAKILFVPCMVFACGGLNAQTNVWQPSPGHIQVPILPGGAPDPPPVPGPENYTTTTNLIAGQPCGEVAGDNWHDFKVGK
jgi:hypothetical protein